MSRRTKERAFLQLRDRHSEARHGILSGWSRRALAFASGALSRYRMERAARNQIPPSGVCGSVARWDRDHPGADRARDLLDAVPDATRGAEAPLPLDSIEAHR